MLDFDLFGDRDLRDEYQPSLPTQCLEISCLRVFPDFSVASDNDLLEVSGTSFYQIFSFQRQAASSDIRQ